MSDGAERSPSLRGDFRKQAYFRIRSQFTHGEWVRTLGFAGILASLVYLTCFWSDPTGTLSGGHTDHVAHVGETRVFPRLGLDLWKIPAVTLFRRLTPDEIERLPADVKAHTEKFPKDTHFVPGWAPDRPLVMNFAHVPRCYPPGIFLLGAPSAILYHYGLISFGASNRLFLAILALTWLAALLAWTASWRIASPSVLRQLLTAFIAAYIWYWMMEGFYDICAVGLASVGVEAMRGKRHALACLLYGLSVFIHPRLFMLGPLFAVAYLTALRGWRALSARERIAFLSGGILFASGFVFALIIQGTVTLHAAAQPPNAVRPGGGPWIAVVPYVLVLVTLAALLVRERALLDAVVMLFGALAFSSQRYLAPWYWLPMLPWAMAPAYSKDEVPPPMTTIAAIARILVIGLFWLASIASRW